MKGSTSAQLARALLLLGPSPDRHCFLERITGVSLPCLSVIFNPVVDSGGCNNTSVHSGYQDSVR